MTSISKDEVARLATLSNVTLASDEIDDLTYDLQGILEYIQQLNELNTEGVEPTYQVTALENVSREDEVKEGVSREDLLALAPDQKDNQVKVPKVL